MKKPRASLPAQGSKPRPQPPAAESLDASQVLDELRTLGRESYKRVMVRNHGVREPCFGVPISALQILRRRIKTNHALALALYDTGNYDAMYLAGMIADDARMTRDDLQRWVDQAYGGCLYGTTVPSVAAGGPHGWEMALQWIESPNPLTAAAGWATLSSLVSIKPDQELDLEALGRLLRRVGKTIHQTPDAVRYQMNAYLIAAACFVVPLTALAREVATVVGRVTADLGENDCTVPVALDYLRQAEARGALGRKRKSAKC